MLDEIMISSLEADRDRWFSEHSLGGMYDFDYYPDPWAPKPKVLKNEMDPMEVKDEQ